jgi:protein-disulfide isomerase
MDIRVTRAYVLPAFLFAGTLLLFAQDWQTMATLPAVDLGGMTAAQQTRTLHALRTTDCACGCAMKIAECRVKDPSCKYSRELAATIGGAVKNGKTEAAAIADAKASKYGHPAETKLLDDAVPIPTIGSPVLGPADARISLVEFSDFQCPYCYKAVEKLRAVLAAYPRDVKLTFKQFPLDSHSQAQIAAQASLAAHSQGKFWPLHDQMFNSHGKLSRQMILDWAQGLRIDMKRFTAEMDAEATKKAVARDQADGEKAGVEGTPTVFVNGQRYNGELALEAFKPVLEAELKRVAGAAKK